jgi:hypothetical protein
MGLFVFAVLRLKPRTSGKLSKPNFIKILLTQARWHMLVIPTLRRLRQKDQKIKAWSIKQHPISKQQQKLISTLWRKLRSIGN